MKKLKFKPRMTFNVDLKYLASIDEAIIDEVRAAIELLLENQKLPPEFNDYQLSRRLADYREFHLRDTPKGQTPTDANDVLVVYKIDKNDLILVGIRVGSHERLFCGKNTAKKHRNN